MFKAMHTRIHARNAIADAAQCSVTLAGSHRAMQYICIGIYLRIVRTHFRGVMFILMRAYISGKHYPVYLFFSHSRSD